MIAQDGVNFYKGLPVGNCKETSSRHLLGYLFLYDRKAEAHQLTVTMAASISADDGREKVHRVQSYLSQHGEVWPKEGKHILAQYDKDSVVVYQAYCPEIADYAVEHQR